MGSALDPRVNSGIETDGEGGAIDRIPVQSQVVGQLMPNLLRPTAISSSRTASSRRGARPSHACVWGIALMSLLLAGCAHAGRSASTDIRVLLYDGNEPIEVGPDEHPHSISIAGGQIVVDDQAVGVRWVPEGQGPWRVGPRRVRGQIRVLLQSERLQVLNRVPL